MKSIKKTICIFLCAIMSLSVFAVSGSAKEPCDCPNAPTIIVPGLMQSSTYLYNEDGTINEDYDAPFFMEDTDSIVNQAVSTLLGPLFSVLLTQNDKDGKFAQGVADVLGSVIGEKLRCDANGNPVYNIDAVHYKGSYAECSTLEQMHILSCVPVQEYLDIAGEDHFYYYSFNSFGNLDKITAGLYDLIQQVKEETGHDKINIVPISQGGVIMNNLLEYYPDVVDSFKRIIYVVPCLDGTSIMSDIYVNGLIDDPEALYGYLIPGLMGDDMTSKLIRIALRILPQAVLQDVLDRAIDTLINDYLGNITTIWGFTKNKDYEVVREKYLMGDDKAEIRRQADSYHQARLNSDKNILAAIDKGVEVFNIVDYNYALYPIVDSWDDINADGVIDLDSTSMGAHAAAVGETLPEGYAQQGNSFGTCSDPTHNHIDPHNVVDASTGLLPDHTFYYYNGNHEATGRNDSLINLIIKLLYDDNFKDVYSYPEMYPQFNEARDGRHMENLVNWSKSLLAGKGADEYPELRAAVEKAEKLLGETVVDYDESLEAMENLEALYKIANGEAPEEKSFTDKILEKFVDGIFAVVEKQYPYRSFSGK